MTVGAKHTASDAGSREPERTDVLTRAMGWLQDRLPVGGLIEVGAHKTVPVHRHSIWYYLGGMALFLFIVQIVTGILLLLYYRPSPESAYESVQFIMTKVRFGWLVRSIHSWAANLLIFVLFVHMFSVLFLRAYRKPREITWYSGAALLMVMMAFGFTGYLLPWNELSFFGTRVGSGIAGSIPLIGDFALRFLRGGPNVTGGTLTRFFGWHVAILPAAATFVLVLHIVLVQIHGMSVPESVERADKAVRRMRFFWNFILRDLLGWVIALGILAALAALFPWELGVKADLFASAPAGIKPEWYFLAMYQALKYVPPVILGMEGEVIGILTFSAIGVLWFFIPAIDRGEASRRTTIVRYAGIAAIIFMVVMSALAFAE